jgi:UDP:flavonoid glycosyltransferase YjiC (YdhE family)
LLVHFGSTTEGRENTEESGFNTTPQRPDTESGANRQDAKDAKGSPESGLTAKTAEKAEANS